MLAYDAMAGNTQTDLAYLTCCTCKNNLSFWVPKLSQGSSGDVEWKSDFTAEHGG